MILVFWTIDWLCWVSVSEVIIKKQLKIQLLNNTVYRRDSQPLAYVPNLVHWLI